MAGARITYRLDGDKAVNDAIKAIGGIVSNATFRTIGLALVETTEHRFDTGTDPDGLAWKALNPAYALIKRGSGILVASRALRKSITFGVRGTEIAVGTNRVYGAIHQFGGKIVAKGPGGLAFNLGSGVEIPRVGKTGRKLKPGQGVLLVRVRSVTIPARPYLGFGPKDQQAVMGELQKAWKKATGA